MSCYPTLIQHRHIILRNPQHQSLTLLYPPGIPVRFVTNETQKTRQSLVAKLHRLGYEMPEAEVFPPALAMAAIVKGKTICICYPQHPR